MKKKQQERHLPNCFFLEPEFSIAFLSRPWNSYEIVVFSFRNHFSSDLPVQFGIGLGVVSHFSTKWRFCRPLFGHLQQMSEFWNTSLANSTFATLRSLSAPFSIIFLQISNFSIKFQFINNFPIFSTIFRTVFELFSALFRRKTNFSNRFRTVFGAFSSKN